MTNQSKNEHYNDINRAADAVNNKTLTTERTTQTSNQPGTELQGSRSLPQELPTADGKTLKAQDVVKGAHEDSGLSVEEWNALLEDDRDAKIFAKATELGFHSDQSMGV